MTATGDRLSPQWGRWGPADERGALNLLGAERVRAAAAAVASGEVVQLGQRLGPGTPVAGHRAPLQRFMLRDGGDYAAGAKRPGGFQFAEDAVLLPTHVGTHVDALAHAWHDDLLYNGFPGASVRSTTGARHCGADALGPIVGRGVLLDVAAAGDLEAGDRVGAADLRAAAGRAGVAVAAGDVVLVRTGWLERTGHSAAAYYDDGEPGLDVEAAAWLAERDVAAVGADNFALEAIPFAHGEAFPVHQLLLRDRGIPIIEGLVLDGLAARAATAFLFVALPLALEGSTASPLSPVAIL